MPSFPFVPCAFTIQSEFHWIGLSLAQTFVMMVGELNYNSNFFGAFESKRLAFPQITYMVFVFFILLMPILLMNLMVTAGALAHKGGSVVGN